MSEEITCPVCLQICSDSNYAVPVHKVEETGYFHYKCWDCYLGDQFCYICNSESEFEIKKENFLDIYKYCKEDYHKSIDPSLKTHNKFYNICKVDEEGKTALIYACENGVIIASELLKTGNSRPNHVDNNLKTALIYACEKKFTDIITELLNTNNSNPNHVDNNNKTALIYAIENNFPKDIIIKLLNTNESNPNQVDNNNKTALIYAIENNFSKDIIELIQSKI